MCFFFLIRIIPFINLSSLTVPFIRYYDSEFLNEKGTLYSKFTNYLGIKIEIGSPPQVLSVNVEFFSNSLWIIDNNSPSLNEYQRGYYKSKSTTVSEIDPTSTYIMTNTKHQAQIKSLKDFIKIEQSEITNCSFFIVEKITNVPFHSGILGLDIDNKKFNILPHGFSFIDQLYEKGLISHKIFTIEYKDVNHGTIFFGNYPHFEDPSYLTGNKVLINRKVNKNFDKNDIWGITFDKISYIGESGFILPNQKVEFVVDLGVIVVPQEYQKIIIESGKVKSLIERKKCLFENVYNKIEYKMLKCFGTEDFSQNFGNLIFTLDNYNIVLTGKDLFTSHYQSTQVLQLAFYSGKDGVKLKEWLIGEPFFKKKEIIYNVEDKKIGFYLGEANLKNKNVSFFKIIISIIIIFIIFIFVYIWYKKRHLKNKSYKYNTNKSLDFEKLDNFSINEELK